MNPLKGFSPDLETTTPGIILDCIQFVPYEAGMRAAPGDVDPGYDALAATCRGAASLRKLDLTVRTIAGTASKLYERSGTTWTDVSAGTYTLGGSSEWSFCQFGDTSVAANIDETIQSSTAGAFAAIATAPQATIVESVLASGGGFVFAFNTIDGTFGTSPDRWWCSAVNDVTLWTPSATTLATTGRLLGAEGPIKAAKKFGSDKIIAYKERSLYIGTYVGSPAVWDWQEVPGFGCVGLNAVANLGTAHFVVGQDNIYIFDGSRPIPVAEACRKWFMDNANVEYRSQAQVTYDRANDLVWIFFRTISSVTGAPDRCLVYHIKTGQWGLADREVERSFIFEAPSATSVTIPTMAVFNTSHKLLTLSGTGEDSSFTLHDIGDDSQVSFLSKSALRYMQTPTTAAVDHTKSMALGIAFASAGSKSAYDDPSGGKNVFPLRATARWHRLVFSFTGSVKVSGYDVAASKVGRR